MPRKMRREALRSALSVLAAEDQIVVVDTLSLDTVKTKVMQIAEQTGRRVQRPGAGERNEAVERSVRNLPNAQTMRASYQNIRDLLSHDRVIIPRDALEVIQLFLSKSE
jgi:large subunit ribosomal protein L4